MSNVLAIANSYVPIYNNELPAAISSILERCAPPEFVIGLGNLGSPVVDVLQKRFRAALRCLRGRLDDNSDQRVNGSWLVIDPEAKIKVAVLIPELACPVGNSCALAELARERGCLVALTSAHSSSVEECDGVLIVRVGGAAPITPEPLNNTNPSVVCLTISDETVVVNIYTETDGNVEREKHEWTPNAAKEEEEQEQAEEEEEQEDEEVEEMEEVVEQTPVFVAQSAEVIPEMGEAAPVPAPAPVYEYGYADEYTY